LPQEPDDSNRSITLPPEELNPLLNPLLSKNMGRWAEVYFTNLPENRDHAVIELLHQLQAEEALQEGLIDPEAITATDGTANLALDRGSGVATSTIRCPHCGYENRPDHNFCGACRTPLKANGNEAGGISDAYAPDQFSGRQGPITHASGNRGLETAEAQEWPVSNEAQGENGERWISADDSIPVPQFATTPRSYRAYIGAVLAILIAFLLYRAWVATQSNVGSAHVTPEAPPALATGNGANPTTASHAAPKAAAPVAVASVKTANAQPAISSPQLRPALKNSTIVRPVPAALQAPAAPASSPAASMISANGASELNLAKSYLNGTDGKERNTTAAVTLLWEAVSKRNAEATELLSELYLKGDGVAQNCDQARVLLDAAASRGSKDAGNWLRHLQAFGCQ